MKIQETRLPGVLLLEPAVHGDSRGFFVETLREEWLAAAGLNLPFVQHNQSRSGRGVLRGLHYQWQRPQGKLVRCARGVIYDVAVDARRDSASFGQWLGVQLDDVKHQQLYLPPGYAHGFLVLSDLADVCYQSTDYYHPASDTGIVWDDPDVAIAWPLAGLSPLLSAKDQALPRLRNQMRLPS